MNVGVESFEQSLSRLPRVNLVAHNAKSVTDEFRLVFPFAPPPNEGVSSDVRALGRWTTRSGQKQHRNSGSARYGNELDKAKQLSERVRAAAPRDAHSPKRAVYGNYSSRVVRIESMEEPSWFWAVQEDESIANENYSLPLTLKMCSDGFSETKIAAIDFLLVVHDASVAFQHLLTGRWLCVGEDEHVLHSPCFGGRPRAPSTSIWSTIGRALGFQAEGEKVEEGDDEVEGRPDAEKAPGDGSEEFKEFEHHYLFSTCVKGLLRCASSGEWCSSASFLSSTPVSFKTRHFPRPWDAVLLCISPDLVRILSFQGYYWSVPQCEDPMCPYVSSAETAYRNDQAIEDHGIPSGDGPTRSESPRPLSSPHHPNVIPHFDMNFSDELRKRVSSRVSRTVVARAPPTVSSTAEERAATRRSVGSVASRTQQRFVSSASHPGEVSEAKAPPSSEEVDDPCGCRRASLAVVAKELTPTETTAFLMNERSEGQWVWE